MSPTKGCPIIVGGGIAGLMTALMLAPMPVLLLSVGPLGGNSSSELAQGGMAASLGVDDSPALHLADTLAAGDGHCDADRPATSSTQHRPQSKSSWNSVSSSTEPRKVRFVSVSKRPIRADASSMQVATPPAAN